MLEYEIKPVNQELISQALDDFRKWERYSRVPLIDQNDLRGAALAGVLLGMASGAPESAPASLQDALIISCGVVVAMTCETPLDRGIDAVMGKLEMGLDKFEERFMRLKAGRK